MVISNGQALLLHYNMADFSCCDVGVCGDQVEMFVEQILPPPMLVIIGARHLDKAVAHLAKWLGLNVAVNDVAEREVLLNVLSGELVAT